MSLRHCSRTACGRPAATTLTYVYADQTAVLGPLATYAEPHAYDLCEVHSERFSAAPVIDGEPFALELAHSGTVIEVWAQQSALAALRNAVPTVAYSCQQGYCGTCVQRVISGEVDHRDTLLTDEQRELGQMLVCVSRAKTPQERLVLDA